MDKKDVILDVASKLFSEKGFEKTPVSAICEQANISHGLVFHHFKNKNGLLRAIFENTTQQVVEMNRSLEQFKAPEDRINKIIDMAFDAMENDKDAFRLYLNIMFQPNTRTILDDLIKERFEVLLNFNKTLLFNGIKEQRQNLYSYLFISELDGIGMNYIYSNEGFPLLEIKEEFRNRYLSYLKQD